MTKITIEIYVDHGVVTRVAKSVEANFAELDFTALHTGMMFTEIPEEGGYDRDSLSAISYWPITDGGKLSLSLTTRRE